MQVLKFGGTSVADAQSISQVVDIVSKAAESDRTILVCSAISKCTDKLIKIGNLASSGDSEYVTCIDELQERHHQIILELLPIEKQAELIEVCDAHFNSLRGICQGVFLLRELSPASLDAIASFGELWSTKIITAKLASIGLATKWIDSRELIKTTEQNGRNAVDTRLTFGRIRRMIENSPITQVFIAPGFIASDIQ